MEHSVYESQISENILIVGPPSKEYSKIYKIANLVCNRIYKTEHSAYGRQICIEYVGFVYSCT
jgi:hypothetical protein